MTALIRILFSGFVISFLGSLPLGTLNTTAFQIAASKNISEAIVFATAVVIVELIIVRITLLGANSIHLDSKFFSYLIPPTILLLIYLAVSNFISASSQQTIHTSSDIFPMIKSTFVLGLILSLLNPLHIPFWMGWNNVLIKREKLYNKPGMYSFYILGIALGSILGLIIFILAGQVVISYYQHYNYLISYLMAVVYIGIAAFLSVKFYKKLPRFTFKKIQ